MKILIKISQIEVCNESLGEIYDLLEHFQFALDFYFSHNLRTPKGHKSGPCHNIFGSLSVPSPDTWDLESSDLACANVTSTKSALLTIFGSHA